MVNTIRTYFIYWLDGRLYGYEIDWKPYPASLGGFERSYLFVGKSASICVVTHDWGIDRTVALRFATSIARGTYTTVNVNLEKIGRNASV